ncbi:MAG: RpiB/LacA/LacB family sugar-phosphate isomerase [Clostridia bacterium]|nr:RpiB/LacA/LacB family sugar-phosphate isomerase [Clostridia bacterium]
MKIGIILASSQKDKMDVIAECVKKITQPMGHETVCYCLPESTEQTFSYVETAVCISLLLSGKAVDFVVTGCSSGQGMMLAANSLPGVLCGYIPMPQDAFLFGRINGGNAASLPLKDGWGWQGKEHLLHTLEKLFDGPFGEGYPAQEADRKKRDTKLMKQTNRTVKRGWAEIADEMDKELLKKALRFPGVYDDIMQNGSNEELKNMLRTHR